MPENSLFEAVLKPFEIFLILILIGVGIHYSDKTPLKSIGKAHIEVACTHGGFTTDDIAEIKKKLAYNGFDPNYVDIKIEPAEARNVTSTNYAKANTIISLELVNNKLGLIDSLFKKLGSSKNIKNDVIFYDVSQGILKNN